MKHRVDFKNLDFNKTITQTAKELNIPFTSLKRVLKQANVFDKFKVSIKDKNRVKYSLNPKKCKFCGKNIPYEKKENVYCSSSCFGFDQPIRPCSEEQKKKLSKIILEKVSRGEYTPPVRKNQWLKARIKKECEACKTIFEVIPSMKKRRFCSVKCSHKNVELGGYRPTAGTVYSGWYKGYFCNSSWELAWVIYSLDHGLKFKRNTESFEYIFGNKVKKYYPDFKLEDSNDYVEIKGFKSAEWEEKIKAFPHKLSIFYKKEMAPILSYVKSKYGKDFIKMYEVANSVKQF